MNTLKNWSTNKIKDIEKLKSDLTKSYDRQSKLHQREFDILPDVWSKICEAYWQTRTLVSPMQSHPDLNRMSDAHLLSFIAACKLPSWQKAELLEEQDKTKYYIDNIFWARLQECRALVTIASNSLGKSGIFINQETQTKLDELTQLLWDSLAEEEMNHRERPTPRLREDINKLIRDGDNMRAALESNIRSILWGRA